MKVLGFIIDEDGLKPIESKVAPIHKEAVPHTVKGIQRFLGLVRYYERFVQGLAELSKPLTWLLKKGVDVNEEWDDKATEAVEKIKKAFSHELVLTWFDPH